MKFDFIEKIRAARYEKIRAIIAQEVEDRMAAADIKRMEAKIGDLMDVLENYRESYDSFIREVRDMEEEIDDLGLDVSDLNRRVDEWEPPEPDYDNMAGEIIKSIYYRL